MKKEEKAVIGLIVGNRNFFPDALVEEGRNRILRALEEAGVEVVCLSSEDTKFGAVETYEDAEKCARLFREHAEEIQGIIATLPNFGDERAVAETVRRSGLHVPILVHAFPDEIGRLDPGHRRDAFCGKLSLCNNLVQYGIKFTNTSYHVESPENPEFKRDLEDFLGICRIVRGLKGAKLGAVGARPAVFNTVRYSEKLLEKYGISVETFDLSEVIAKANKLDRASQEVQRELHRLKESFSPVEIPQRALEKMAQLAVVLEEWVELNSIDAFAFQCWTAIEEIYGVVPCAVMSLFSESMIPAACEVDVMGALAMYVLMLAAEKPAALMDWNNNFGDDPNKLILFHCSNFPCSFFNKCTMAYQHIIAETVGKENTYGTVVGRVTSGPATFLRLSTLDLKGVIAGVLAEGWFTEDEVETFGGYGVAEISRLQELLTLLVQKGLEHHVAVVKNHVGKRVKEALEKYMGWEIFSFAMQ